ncbi:ankyrin repeat and protein kinase domain-containing protein 1 isoform X1 [Rana temporaria]|uniref:ankyrin repeat and protein kinase domain-containing protein 1 isoform X1 n=2 Tax=Rana temporaria TaxID=8407 RepID=UPI001AACD9D8|nr:ankyrin repeat and protein kinase domain-containing protein 1 isoform X1 [Rana temporaria]
MTNAGGEQIGNLTQFKKEDFENDWTPIALGGFGKVYKVRHKKWWSIYAVKCSTLHGDPELESTTYNNLMEEASKMEKIKFRYVVQIYGICIDPLGIVMEFMENGSLEKLIPTHTLSWQLKFRFIHEIALGMNFLHIMNPPLLHLDLKPGNILLDEHLHVKISDFGLSKWKENSTRKEYIERSAIKGTLNYIPPEMFLQSSQVMGTKYDVYSYSIVIWELLTQKKPFVGNSMMTVIVKVAGGQRPPLEDISEDGPVECQQIIDLMQRCWNQNPNKRPSFSDIIVESHMLLCLVQSPLPEQVGSWSKDDKDHVKSSALIVNNISSDGSCNPSCSSSISSEIFISEIFQNNSDNISWVDENNFTLLHFAVSQGNPERVNHFLSLNANINSRTVSGYTPLILAVQKKLPDICAILIENGADVNIIDEDKWSPLHFAAQAGDDRIARLLLDHGAQVDAVERDDWTALHLASQNGFENVARVLFTRQTNPNCQETDGKTALHIASYFGHYKLVKLLISQGADRDAKQKNLRTPLHISADRGYFRVVQHLIQKGANVNCGDQSHYSPLHMAAVKGNSMICKLLIKHGAQVNIKNNQGWTPLHLAIFKGHTEIIHLLKDNDAALDAEGDMKWTPLHLAVRYSEDSIISLLLDFGADPNFAEMSGWTPLHLAVQRSSFGNVIKLIEKKANVDAQNKFGWTPLHVAVLNANAAIVKTLLRANAKQNIEDSSGCTPLQLAVRNHKNSIATLLEGGLDTSSTSSEEVSEELGPYLNFQDLTLHN